MVDGLFFCATLTGRRADHTPFAQAGAETSNTSAGVFKPDPDRFGRVISGGCALVWGMKVWSLVGLSAHLAFHWWSGQCAACMLLLSDKLVSGCAAGTNECLDLRSRAFTLDGQMSAEWSKCPGFLARCSRDSVATLRRSSAGWMPAWMGRLSAGVGRRHPSLFIAHHLYCKTRRRNFVL